MSGPLCARIGELCDQVAALVPGGPEGDVLQRVRAGLGEPLRLAVAGRVSSGKSTLVNALLRQRVAPTDVSECTRYVTTYRYGVPERVEIVERDGMRHSEALLPDGSLPRSPGEGIGDVARLEVFLANDALRDIVLIDTPGLGSLDGERTTSTVSLLGLDGDSQAAVADADALVFVLTASLRGDEAELLRGFHKVLVGSSASTLSTLAVLNKADLIDDGDGDPLATARRLAARFTEALRDVVTDVQPLVSLLAETVATGRFTEGHAVALRALASMPAPQRGALLLTVDRFRGADAPIASGDRADLLEAVGLYGVRLAMALIDAGTTSASALLGELRDRSGFDGLRRRVLDGFAGDADALKASGALAALERLSYAMTDPALAEARAELHDGIDALRTEPLMHRLSELRASNEVATRQVELPDELDGELRRLVAGSTPAERLGLASDARPDEIQRAAASAAAAWKRFRNDGRAGPDQQWVADVMTQTCERLWLEAGRVASGTGT